MTYQINWECQAPPSVEPGSYSYTQRVSITTFGETAAEHEAQAVLQATNIQGFDLRAVGLNNNKADWEAVYGPSKYPNGFANTSIPPPEPVKKSWFNRIFR